MFMRTVKMHVKPDRLHEFRTAYADVILKAFADVRGCRSAALMQSMDNPAHCVSLTFWTSEEDVRAYEQGGQYEKLVGVLSPHFSESSELQIRLTKDLKLEYVPSGNEPEVRTFEVASEEDSSAGGEFFIRMVSLKFKTEKVDEFKKHYAEHVIPVLRQVQGCRRAFLAAPADNPNELISVTEWENERAAQAYEHGGQFDALLKSQRHFFSGLSIWSLTKQKETGKNVATSDDVIVDHYITLATQRFDKER